MGDETSTIVFVKGMGDIVKSVASTYKNTCFVVINEAVESGENLGAIVYNNNEINFIQGAVATLLSNNKTLGKSEVAFSGGSKKINSRYSIL